MGGIIMKYEAVFEALTNSVTLFSPEKAKSKKRREGMVRFKHKPSGWS